MTRIGDRAVAFTDIRNMSQLIDALRHGHHVANVPQYALTFREPLRVTIRWDENDYGGAACSVEIE